MVERFGGLRINREKEKTETEDELWIIFGLMSRQINIWYNEGMVYSVVIGDSLLPLVPSR